MHAIGNNTIIHLDEKDIEDNVIDIVTKLSNCEVFDHIRVMPDCHMGISCCIGFTSVINDKVIPNIVGGDIGCGISCYCLNKKIKPKQYKKIDEAVKERIPMGEKIHLQSIATDEIMQEIYDECNSKLTNLRDKFNQYDFTEYNNTYFVNLINKIGKKKKGTLFLRALGTLGSGNHYVEFNENDEETAYISVHSGSRSLGQAVCNYHQDKANAKRERKKDGLLSTYLDGDDMIEYLIDMLFAQTFASKNRELMIRIICDIVNVEFVKECMIDTTHNYIDFERFIVRKGAIAAEENKLCIISLNMKDGILICRGKGNENWNYSSAHGCGRIMTRTEARHSITLDKFKKEMLDVYSTSICKDTIDEAPMAYKNVDHIKNSIGDSVTILKQLQPIINIKGY